MAAAFSKVIIFILLSQALSTALPLEIHFYRNSCPRAELIVKSIVRRHFQQDPSLAAGLLRLHFHDCFISGCDASVLIDSTDDNVAEKEAPPNLTLRGFEVIDEIKTTLEKECKGVVSCADILALATRDGVSMIGGAAYALPTGRRDGTVSKMGNVRIIGPSFSVPAALNGFKNIGLDLVDLTTLLGAHSVGFCHCGFFVDRLYNFQGSGSPDPSLDPVLLNTLKEKCPPDLLQSKNTSTDPKVFMNQASNAPFTINSSFYRGVLNEKAVLQLDQQLAFTDFTSNLAAQYVNRPNLFRKQFSISMIKLGNVGVLTGEQGEIRLNCRNVNDGTTNK